MKGSMRQRILRRVYPILMRIGGSINKHSIILKNNRNEKPAACIKNLSVTLITGDVIHIEKLRGKKLLIVNTASDCGYTAQYEELQKLQDSYAEQLVVIGFPANDFKEQEKGNDMEIAQFCKVSFGVRFALAKKSVVIKSDAQNEIFSWLTDSKKNGWNNQQPVWNFCKYLVNEDGVLTHFFGPAISPLSQEVIQALKK